jgi:hypothetical protein
VTVRELHCVALGLAVAALLAGCGSVQRELPRHDAVVRARAVVRSGVVGQRSAIFGHSIAFRGMARVGKTWRASFFDATRNASLCVDLPVKGQRGVDSGLPVFPVIEVPCNQRPSY